MGRLVRASLLQSCSCRATCEEGGATWQQTLPSGSRLAGLPRCPAAHTFLFEGSLDRAPAHAGTCAGTGKETSGLHAEVQGVAVIRHDGVAAGAPHVCTVCCPADPQLLFWQGVMFKAPPPQIAAPLDLTSPECATRCRHSAGAALPILKVPARNAGAPAALLLEQHMNNTGTAPQCYCTTALLKVRSDSMRLTCCLPSQALEGRTICWLCRWILGACHHAAYLTQQRAG